jgi:hypothetical protein
MTIGELQNRVETKLFPNRPTNDFEKKCKAREDAIKQYIEICRTMIMHHIEKPQINSNNLSVWKKEKIKKNINNLIKYTEELAEELDKVKIEEYCRNINLKFLNRAFDPDIIFLIENSYYGSVITDILWASDITVYEAMQISAGKLDMHELGKKLPDKVKETKKKILPYFKSSKRYNRHSSNLQEAINCYEKKFHKACNLLLMTTIEGLVRDIADFLNKEQRLNLNLNTTKFNSLDSLLRNGGWKEDFEISSERLSLITGQDQTAKERSIPTLEDPFRMRKINLKTRLDFLRRRFKEDRDLILHGLYHDYGNQWNLFLNFSALFEVFIVIKYYDNQFDK